jgi:hypothetical protein
MPIDMLQPDLTRGRGAYTLTETAHEDYGPRIAQGGVWLLRTNGSRRNVGARTSRRPCLGTQHRCAPAAPATRHARQLLKFAEDWARSEGYLDRCHVGRSRKVSRVVERATILPLRSVPRTQRALGIFPCK